ncbi:MAG: hypothetical protein AAB388_03265 [Patescibacteria group bacterium]
MLAIFFGTDRTALHDAGTLFLSTKGAPPLVPTIDAASYAPGVLTNAAGATSLFGATEYFILDTPSADEAFEAEVLDVLPLLEESTNVFVVFEGALLAPLKKKYQKYTAVVEEYTATKADRFNLFALTDALARKDKKKLWVLLVEARQAGISDEEIVGLLWWQLKTMHLAALSKSAVEAGLKDFPYQKAKQALAHFSSEELDALSHTLLSLYHEGHAGVRELDLALESWLLSV